LALAPESSLLSKSFNIEEAAKSAYARLADGAYVDDTSVAFAVSHIQDSEGLDDHFEITLFMNSTPDPLTGLPLPVNSSQKSSFFLPGNFTKLFGYETNGALVKDNLTTFNPIPTKPVIPSSWILDSSAIDKLQQPTWSYQNADYPSLSLAFYPLNVKTIDNPTLGIEGGQHGIVNLFISHNAGSLPAPLKLSTFQKYDQNFGFMQQAFQDPIVWNTFRSTLGLS